MNASKVININDKRQEAVAARYKEIKAQQAALAKEEKELKALIIGWVPENSTAVIGPYTIIHECAETHALDQDALKAIYPELWREYDKVGSRRTVKVIG